MNKTILALTAVAAVSVSQGVDLAPSVYFTFTDTLTDSMMGTVATAYDNTGFDNSLGNTTTITYTSGVLLPSGTMDTVANFGYRQFMKTDHNAAPNGGGSFVNQYSILLDLRVPEENAWVAFFQTNVNNTNDGDYWIRDSDSLFGVSSDYSGAPLDRSKWNRVILTVDNAAGVINTYVDGAFVRTQSPGNGVDGRWSLDPQILFMADNDGEMPSSYQLANAAMFAGVIDADQAGRLGVAGSAVPEPASLIALGAGALALARRRRK